MASLNNINISDSFFRDEHLSNRKFNNIIYTYLSLLNNNNASINAEITTLLQDESGEAEQANLLFIKESAPDGWQRNIHVENDTILRVTDGVSVPDGDNPNANGGSEGGSWTISNITASNENEHTHTNAHTHSLSNHTHNFTGHTHNLITHTHTLSSHNHSGSWSSDETSTSTGFSISVPSSGGSSSEYASSHGHFFGSSHTISSVGTTSSSPNTLVIGLSAVSTSSEIGNSDETAPTITTESSHSHTFTWDSLWRPQYINGIICQKDTYTNLVSIDSPVIWKNRSQPTSANFNSEIKLKINYNILNAMYNNTNLVSIFKGSDDLDNQAKISLAMSSAPTGWTRDTSFTTDHFLRVTTGAGGGTGGSWTINGYTFSSNLGHAHTINAHDHGLTTHTHTVNDHLHTMAHSHTYNHQHGISSTTHSLNQPYFVYAINGSTVNVTLRNHSHTIPTHDHGGLTINSTLTSGGYLENLYTGNSNGTIGASVDSTSSNGITTTSDGAHDHTIYHDGTWRPQYLNVIICKKD